MRASSLAWLCLLLQTASSVGAPSAVSIEPVAAAERQAPPRSPENASYTLSARLDPVNHTIWASGRLSWRNISRTPTTELRFHLYWNAWRTAGSTWMKEAALSGSPVDSARIDRDPGLIDLTTLKLADGSDLLARATFIAPDDRNATDQTLLAVPLTTPVQPGETIDVDLAWNAHVPRTFARTGVLGDVFFIAQWFPKIGVLGEDGWSAHQFHAITEFFADFGRYDVSLTVPAGWIVGATGREQSQAANADGTTTHRYVARDVHDFAWTTSPDAVEVTDRFNESGLPPVDIRLLLRPEHRRQAARHLAAVHAALDGFGRAYGPYAYDTLTIVDPVTIVDPDTQGAEIAGMEYPMLITAGTSVAAPESGDAPEDTIVHEIAHQFFYAAVATNEVDHAWMDEGLATYVGARLIDKVWPGRFVRVGRYFGGLIAWPYRGVARTRAIEGNGSAVYRREAGDEVPAMDAWKYWPATGPTTVYYQAALWLTTLERLIGDEAMQRIVATYYQRHTFQHPAPDEFFAIASEVSGRDLTWFFDAVYRQAATFDYAVDSVSAIPTATGAIDSVIRVRRLGNGVFPIDVRTTFHDGASVTEHWDGEAPWHAFRYRRGAGVRTVEVDPDRVLALDVHTVNNTWTSSPAAGAAATAVAVRWLAWFEHVLLTYAFFG